MEGRAQLWLSRNLTWPALVSASSHGIQPCQAQQEQPTLAHPCTPLAGECIFNVANSRRQANTAGPRIYLRRTSLSTIAQLQAGFGHVHFNIWQRPRLAEQERDTFLPLSESVRRELDRRQHGQET